jgi:hypothetical protein
MNDSIIYLGETESTYTPAALADKIYEAGKSKVRNLFQTYKNEMDYNLSQPHLNFEAKQKLITIEIEKLGLTYEKLKLAKSPTKQKHGIIQSLEVILGLLGERRLPMHQFDIHASNVSVTLTSTRVKNYLMKEFEKCVQKPEIGEKIKFLGTPSQFAYMINVLIDKGFIEKVNSGKNGKSLRKIASILYNSFYISNSDETGETPFDNFYKEFRANSLSPAGRDWIVIRKFK